jgi:glutamate racemase
VGVLATAGTFESQRYASLMERFAQDVTMFENPCMGLVEQVESGDTSGAKALLTRVLTPMLNAGIDTLILGCTHFPFVVTEIEEIVGDIAIIDPAPAVAEQTKRILAKRGLLVNAGVGEMWGMTTGNAGIFTQQCQRLIHTPIAITQLYWQ